jgi:mannose-6-phosphate isomerase-like protein (cupin superfamily)
MAKRLHRANPVTGKRRSLRKISAELADAGTGSSDPRRTAGSLATQRPECYRVSAKQLARSVMQDKIKLSDKLATFNEHWSPRTVAQLNNYDVMVVKVKGEFVWHKHDDTDDFFLVLNGTLDIQLRDRTVALGPGELFIVPKGIEHRPVAREEVHLLLIEPTGTPNTGDAKTAAPRKTA